MDRKIFVSSLFLLVLIQSLLVIENECIRINELELSRIFTRAHSQRLLAEAREVAEELGIPLSQAKLRKLSFSSGQTPNRPPFMAPLPPPPPTVSSPIGYTSPYQQNYLPQHPTEHPPRNPAQQIDLMSSFNKYTPTSVAVNNYALTGLDVSRKLLSEKLANDPNPLQTLSTIKAPFKFCPFKKPIECDPSYPYRNFDGSCNNLQNLWWGKSETPFKRYLPADYSDQYKLNDPRISVDGSELPNARDLACSLHNELHEIEPFITHMFMQWGQWINHDITSLAITRIEPEDPDKTRCKSCTKSARCLPIEIKSNFTCNCINQILNRSCIFFTRSSATFSDIQCSLGQREQLQLQTSYLDGSAVYGPIDKIADSLREKSFGKGLLKVQRTAYNQDLLPPDLTPKPSDCLDFSETTRCFKAGDERVNQNPGIMSMHTLFVREHNRIANILAQINPIWNDETVFQETRRIIAAITQHITYNEYLPILLSPRTMEIYNLYPGKGYEQFNGYDPTRDPRIANEYSAAFGRFGHSMVRSKYSRVNATYEQSGSTAFMLRDSYFRSVGLHNECEGGLESIVRGLLKDPAMKVDRWFTEDLSRHLFETTDKLGRPKNNFDLVSINIQRGRDHGVPGYLKFREFCGLPPIRNWDEMARYVSGDVVSLLSQFYKYVEDVDLFIATLSEFKEEGSIVGPTLNCLLGLQYQDIKVGDRFWYETNQEPARFTPGQLNEIRKYSLSKFLCRNLKDTPLIQPRALLSKELPDNNLVSCENLPDIDWSFWRD